MSPTRSLLLALIPFAAALVAVGLILVGLALAGYAPGDVLATAWRGLAGSPLRLGIWAQEATPLLLTGLAAGLAFRCGVLNVGTEGQYLMGAVTALAVLLALPPSAVSPWLAALAGAGAGALWCGVAYGLDRWRGVPLVLSAILLNVVAARVLGALVEGPLHDPTTAAPQSALVPDLARLSVLMPGTALTWAAPLAVALAVWSWLVQRQTALGFEFTVIGLNPVAADLAGIPVESRRRLAALGSGALAGLAGAFQVAGVTWFLSGDAQSYGYAGIAVALLGRLHPLGMIPAALFFAGLDLSGRQWERRLGIPHDLGDVAKGVAVALVLAAGLFRGRR